MPQVKLALGLIGPGLVGKALLSQIEQQAGCYSGPHGAALRVCGIANSRKMMISDPAKTSGLELSNWQQELAQGEQSSLEVFLERLAGHKEYPVLIDCSASQEVPQHYARWLGQPNCSIVTPNKQLGAGSLSNYRAVMQACSQTGNQFFYEATVGAGLPVISTLKALLHTGDPVEKIEGIFSGTLSYIFNSFNAQTPFSNVVMQAKEAGYTEPDPREDLSGMDVARKVTILARECGLAVKLSEVEVESLVPDDLRTSPSAESFLEALPNSGFIGSTPLSVAEQEEPLDCLFDETWQTKAAEASEAGHKLCYVGQIDLAERRCKVGLQAYPLSHAFAQLQGADNIISFQTKRYSQQPIFIRGPGAGAEVTAAGVFSDILLLAQNLGARL